MVKIDELVEHMSGAMGAERVFGAYEKNGVTVIPAARIMGGAGGGRAEVPPLAEEPGAPSEHAEQGGSGAGFGLRAAPVGAYVIKGEDVRWLPAVDVNRLMLGFQIVMIVLFLTVRSIAKARAAAAKQE